jgi:hypothetical protein
MCLIYLPAIIPNLVGTYTIEIQILSKLNIKTRPQCTVNIGSLIWHA